MNFNQVEKAYAAIFRAGYAFENITEKAEQDKGSEQPSENSNLKKHHIQPKTTGILTPSTGINFKQAVLLASETAEKIQNTNIYLRQNLHQLPEFHFFGSKYV